MVDCEEGRARFYSAQNPVTRQILKIVPNSFFGHTGRLDRISINAENVDGILK